MSLRIRTAAEVQAGREAAERAQRSAEAQAYLAATDWAVIRAIETGKPVPETVAMARAEARRIAAARQPEAIAPAEVRSSREEGRKKG